MPRYKANGIPKNHFGDFLYNFLSRTGASIAQLSEVSGVKVPYIRLYIYCGTQPQIKHFIGLINGCSKITGLPRSMMMDRLFYAIDKDFQKLPFPPKKRTFEE
jgi:hypothetical protein